MIIVVIVIFGFFVPLIKLELENRIVKMLKKKTEKRRKLWKSWTLTLDLSWSNSTK